MSEEDFKISADFSDAIKEFEKFNKTVGKTNDIGQTLYAHWSKFEKGAQGVVKVTAAMSAGVGQYIKQLNRVGQGYTELHGITTKYLDTYVRLHTKSTAVVKGLEQEAVATRNLRLEREKLARVATVSIGPETFRAPKRGPPPGTVLQYSATTSDAGISAGFDPNWEQSILDASKQRVAEIMRRQTAITSGQNIASQQAAANRVAYARQARLERYRSFQQDRLQGLGQLALAAPGGFIGPQNNPNPATPVQGAFSGLGHFIGRGAEIFALYHSIRLVTGAFEDTVGAAKKFMKQITEIRTITQNSGVTFDQFKDQILAVSNAFGLTAEDVAEATYQAISNQVVSAANAMSFMAEAAKFAQVSQSSLTESVNLLSSALNAYNIDASQADQVSAILFKTIELGRLRTSEISANFGNVAVTASELGVTLEELSAALAAMTVNGVKPANAMTYLRSLMTSLAKPSKELSEYLESINYESGQAAVQVEGFNGLLARFSKEADGNIKRMAELTPNIRGLQAALALTGKNASTFADDLKKISNSIESSKIAGLEVMTSSAVKLDQQIQMLRNHFINLWVDILQGSTQAVQGIFGLEHAGNLLLATITALVARFVTMKLSTIAQTAATEGWAAALLGVEVAANGVRIAFLSLKNVATFGVFILAELFLELRSNAEKTKQELELLISEGFSKLNASIASDTAPAVDNINEKFKGLQKTLLEANSGLLNAQRAQETYAKSVKDNMVKAINEQIEATKESIAEFKKQQTEVEDAVKDSVKKQRELQEKLNNDDLQRRLGGLGPEERKRALQVEIELAKKRAEELSKVGTKYSSEEARREAAKAVEYAKELAALQDEGIQRDKSAIQYHAENEADRKARRIAEINHLQEIGVATDEHAREKSKLLEEEKVLQKTIADEEEKRLARTFNTQGKYETATKTVRDAQKAQIDIEKASQDAAQKEIDYLKLQILQREKSVDALKEQEKSWKAIAEGAEGAAAAMDLVVGSLKQIKLFGNANDLVDKMKLAVQTVKDFETLKSAKDAVETRRQELQKARELQATVAQAEPGAVVKGLQDSVPILKGIVGIKLTHAAQEWDEEIVQSGLERLQDAIQERLEKYAELMRKGLTSEAVQQLQLTPDEIRQIQSFKNAAGPSSIFRRLASPEDLQLLEGYARQLSGEKTPITEAQSYVPTTPLQKAFQHFRQLSGGAEGSLSQEEFDLLKNAVPALKDSNTTLEKLNSSFKVTTIDLIEVDPALKKLVNEANALAERLKLTGVDITNKAQVKERQQDANSVDQVLEGADKKAGGGYTYRPGIHGRNEFVVNTGSTNKYRSLLEQINNGNETFVPGQMGGRTGGYNPNEFLNQFGFIRMDGRLLSKAYLGIPFADEHNLYSGLRTRLQETAIKFGSSVGDATDRGLELSGYRFNPYSERQDYRSQARDVRFGDIHVKGDLGDRQAIGATVDVIMTEIRRRLARGLGTL